MSAGVSFALKASKKKTKTTTTLEGFELPPKEPSIQDFSTNKEPLVIPVQEDGRKSLQEQARLRREQQQQQPIPNTATSNTNTNTTTSKEEERILLSKEDQAAIQALNAEASVDPSSEATTSNNKMVIASTENTFQRGGEKQQQQQQQQKKDEDVQLLQDDLDKMAPEVSVDSEVYQQVPISDFGAAMLRGMGWTGKVDKRDADATSLPRPSRLGLGATPKMELNAPTHGRRRPRRQDQVQRDEQLKQQQLEYEQQRQENIKRDKQRTIQVGSIVSVVVTNHNHNHNEEEEDVHLQRRRAIIRKWQGVPGLNMILLQYEGDDSEALKVKRGSVRLVERSEMEQTPFQEPYYKEPKREYLGQKQQEQQQEKQRDEEDDEDRRRDRERRRRRDDDHDDRRRRRDNNNDDEEEDGDRRRRRSEKDSDDDRRRRRSSREEDEDDRKRRRDKEDRRKQQRREDDHDRKRRRTEPSTTTTTPPPITTTWLVPSIRVRVISTKMGKSYYKEKGVVVDVLKGTATLKMNHTGQVLQIPERYLETSLPKVGGNACILTGEHRLAKGRLLERDSKKNKGVVQVFEDMNIVTTSLDDMAEWCGPLDDDLME